MNFIRKHTLELAAQGVDRPSARLFSNPAGDFGSMVNERVSESEREALGEVEVPSVWHSSRRSTPSIARASLLAVVSG